MNDGLKIVAEVFALMQNSREELLRRGDKKSLRLAQILDNGKEAMKFDFEKLTLE